MVAVFGVLLLAIYVLGNRWAYNQFRRPKPRPWTKGNVFAQLPIVGILLALFAGLGFVGYQVQQRAELDFDGIDGASVALICVGTAVAYLALRRQWRAYQEEAPAPGVVDGGGAPGSGRPPRPNAGSRRDAA